jgi:hypothetical protein
MNKFRPTVQVLARFTLVSTYRETDSIHKAIFSYSVGDDDVEISQSLEIDVFTIKILSPIHYAYEKLKKKRMKSVVESRGL